MRGLQCRGEAEENSRRDRDEKREGEHASIDADIIPSWGAGDDLSVDVGDQRSHSPDCEQRAEAAAD